MPNEWTSTWGAIDKLPDAVERLIPDLLIEVRRPDGYPDLSPHEEATARAWLLRILIDTAARKFHRRELQHYAQTAGSNEWFTELRVGAVVADGPAVLSLLEVVRLLLDPEALEDLVELLEAEEPGWRDEAMVALGTELLAEAEAESRAACPAGYSVVHIQPGDSTRTRPGDLAPPVPPARPWRGFWPFVATNLLVAACCVPVSLFGLFSRTYPDGVVCAFWPAAGYSLLAVLFLGRRVAPGVFLGAGAANLIMFWLAREQVNVGFAVCTALGSTVQSLVARHVLRDALQGPENLINSADLLGVVKVLFQTGLCCTISATFGVLSYYLTNERELLHLALLKHWLIWLVGDAIGMVVCASLVLAVLARVRIGRLGSTVIPVVPLAGGGLVVAGVAALLVFLPFAHWVAVPYCVALCLVAVVTTRCGQISGHLTALVFCACATMGANHRAPNGLLGTQTVMQLYSFQLMLVVVSIHLGNVVRRTQLEGDRYRVINEFSRDGYFQADHSGRFQWFSTLALQLQGFQSLHECERHGWDRFLLPGGHAENARRRWQEYTESSRTASGAEPFSDLRIYRTTGGATRVVEIKAEPVFDHGVLIGYFGTMWELSNAIQQVQLREVLHHELAERVPEPKRGLVGLEIDPNIPTRVTLSLDNLLSAFRILIARAVASEAGFVSILVREVGTELQLSLSSEPNGDATDRTDEEVINHLNAHVPHNNERAVRILVP